MVLAQMQSQFDMLNYAGKVFGKPNTTDKVGGVFYVDSGATDASDGNLGTDPNQPLATLNGAMDRVTASNGDIVYLMPGHGENLDAATDAVVDVAGVRIIGIGYGTTRPTFTWTGTSGTFEVDSANTYIENVRFLSSISAVTVGVNVDAAAATFYDCEWNFDATGDDGLHARGGVDKPAHEGVLRFHSENDACDSRGGGRISRSRARNRWRRIRIHRNVPCALVCHDR